MCVRERGKEGERERERPRVRAGFIEPPVNGPSAKTPTIIANPIASGAAFFAAGKRKGKRENGKQKWV